MGVINPKKIMPRTIGLTILPKASPNINHALFNGVNKDWKKKLPIKKKPLRSNSKPMIDVDSFFEIAYRAKIKQMPKNNKPNFLLLGI